MLARGVTVLVEKYMGETTSASRPPSVVVVELVVGVDDDVASRRSEGTAKNRCVDVVRVAVGLASVPTSPATSVVAVVDDTFNESYSLGLYGKLGMCSTDCNGD